MIGIVTPLYPVAAVFFSILIMGDRLVMVQWFAFVLILAGMIICQRFRK
jgi:EamA-like transporter family.